ncbi:MAG: Nre family DNA repair protein [Candidatus Diapherotrites archaeon]
MPSQKMCLACKGRLWCGPKCHILEKYSRRKRITSKIKNNEFSGTMPPGVFVSWTSYPKISLAPLSPPFSGTDIKVMDTPEQWFNKDRDEIINFRESLIRANRKFNVTSASNPSYDLVEIQESIMSSEPVDVEITLTRTPNYELSFSDSSAPLGPSADLKTFKLNENPKIPQKVDYLVSDTDVNSNTALTELHSSGFDVSYLYKLLSSGVLGVKKNRRLVPTRWAITATDSNISSQLIDKIKYMKELNEIQIFNSEYLGNYFHVLIYPSQWEFENLESWQPGTVWTSDETSANIMSDSEFYKGRKTYASNTAGAYYASRLAVAEYLTKQKRQAGCIIFREISKDYDIPMGVWVIRETVRNALSKSPLKFYDFNLALNYLSTKLKNPMKSYSQMSSLIDKRKHQKRISEFF